MSKLSPAAFLAAFSLSLAFLLSPAAVPHASAQAEIRLPRRHAEFMADPGYRSAFEACLTLAALGGEMPGPDWQAVFEAGMSRLPSPDAPLAEWRDAYKVESTLYGGTLGKRIPGRSDAPYQGYYEMKSDNCGNCRQKAWMTVTAVGGGPEYGVSLFSPAEGAGRACSAEAVAGKAVNSTLTVAGPDPETSLRIVFINEDEAAVGPIGATVGYCRGTAELAGYYVRANDLR